MRQVFGIAKGKITPSDMLRKSEFDEIAPLGFLYDG